MSLIYNYFDLLELFCDEPQYINKEKTILLFTKKNNLRYLFTFIFDVTQHTAYISLSDEKLSSRLYEIRINNVSEIVCIAGKAGVLIIKRSTTQNLIQITFNPIFILKVGVHERIAWR